MKKSVLLISGVGVGAGLLYLFNLSRRNGASESTTHQNDGAERASVYRNRQGGKSAASSSKADSNVASQAKSDGRRSSIAKVPGGPGADTSANGKNGSEPVIDDRGTDQHEASEILKSVRDAAFDSNDEKLALALGRPTEEIEAWTNGSEDIDGDVLMKARTLAINRGVEI